ncbi:galactosylceramide sulfotransferase-like [Saccoglossus kowalevskii]
MLFSKHRIVLKETKMYKQQSIGHSRKEVLISPEETTLGKPEMHENNITGISKNCSPIIKYIFVKTTKTAGSAVTTLFFRYAVTHNLIAVANLETHELHVSDGKVNASRYSCAKHFPGYDVIANHISWYDYKALNSEIPNAKFITVLRSPYTQYESAFYYYKIHLNLKLERFNNPFKEFLDQGYHKTNNSRMRHQKRNGQLVRLGYPRLGDHNNQTKIELKISELDKELDLVMLTEYLDESCVLLKKMMCWETDDVIFGTCYRLPRPRIPITSKMENIIAEWNAGDLKLYQHFNKTLWTKIENYDGDFEGDLQQLRERKNELSSLCVDKVSELGCEAINRCYAAWKTILSKRQEERFCGTSTH